MSIPALIACSQEVRRLSIAGSGLARGDYRLKRLAEPLTASAAKAPVFGRVAERVEALVDADAEGSAAALLDLATLCHAVLYTQGQTDVPGELQPLSPVEGGLGARQTPAKVLRPLLDALTRSGAGRMTIVKNAARRGVFNDLRLVEPSLAALDNPYGEFADFVAGQVLPKYGRPIVPALRDRLDLSGGRGDARRLRVLGAILGGEGWDLYIQALGEGSTAVRVAAVEALASHEDALPLLVEQAGAKSGDVRAAAFQALSRSPSQQAADLLIAATRGPDLDRVAGPIRASDNPMLRDEVWQEAAAAVDHVLAVGKPEPADLDRAAVLIGCIACPLDPPAEAFLVSCLDRMDELARVKVPTSSHRSGEDVLAEACLVLARGGSEDARRRLVRDAAKAGSDRLYAIALDTGRKVDSAEAFYDRFASDLKADDRTGPRRQNRLVDHLIAASSDGPGGREVDPPLAWCRSPGRADAAGRRAGPAGRPGGGRDAHGGRRAGGGRRRGGPARGADPGRSPRHHRGILRGVASPGRGRPGAPVPVLWHCAAAAPRRRSAARVPRRRTARATRPSAAQTDRRASGRREGFHMKTKPKTNTNAPTGSRSAADAEATPGSAPGATPGADAAPDSLRPPAERLYAAELRALIDAEAHPVPAGWRMSPRSVLTYIVGGKAGKTPITPKYIGHRRLVEVAVATLVTDRALLLIGEPGTAKSWLSEHLAAAINGDSTLVVQGTAGTTEEHVRYSWNYAMLLANGPSHEAMIPSPIFRAMRAGSIARFEEITRCAPEVQDALISLLSEKRVSVPELELEVPARRGFSIIATANTRDRGVNDMSAALKRRFNIVILPAPADLQTEVEIVQKRVAELADQLDLRAEPPDGDTAEKVVTIFRELRTGQTLDGKNKVKPPSGVLSTAEAISLLANAMSLAGHFGEGAISPDDLAAGLQGAIVKDEGKDAAVWQEYLANIMKKRGSAWRDLHTACKDQNGG